jgi:putative transposase
MSIRLTPFVKGEYYHIYNRGNSKQVIFHDDDDMARFQDLLYILNKPERVDIRATKRGGVSSENTPDEGKTFANTTLVAIGSYCLMPNHFHILITPLVDDSVSKFMQKVSTAYSMYYNKKYKHSGGLFEGKFKAKYIPDDRYLKYLFAYINLNPVKCIDPTWKQYGIKNIDATFRFLDNYTYSSYLDFIHYEGKTFAGTDSNKRAEAAILSLTDFPEYFPTGSHFKKEILAWLLYRDTF